MNVWQKGGQSVSRIVLILFLFLLIALGVFWLVSKVLQPSPLQRLSSKNAQWIVVVHNPEAVGNILAKIEETGTRVSEPWKKVLPSLPEETVVVGYASNTVAAFRAEEQPCAGFQTQGVGSTLVHGMCILHSQDLQEELLQTKEGSLASVYGKNLPDMPRDVAVLLTEFFPYQAIIDALWTAEVTPETLLARALVAQGYPVAVTVDMQDDTAHVEGQIIMDSSKPLPESVQNLVADDAILQSVPTAGPFVAFAVEREALLDMEDWGRGVLGEKVMRLLQHQLSVALERFTPVYLDPQKVPSVSVLVAGPTEEGGWSGLFTGVDEEDQKNLQEFIDDALIYRFGISRTSTTLPDRSRGTLVTASMDDIAVDTTTMSGTTMTTYSTEDTPRMIMESTEDTVRLRDPRVASGVILRALEGDTQELPWQLPLQKQQSVVFRLSLPQENTLYGGVRFLRDRLHFELTLTTK